MLPKLEEKLETMYKDWKTVLRRGQSPVAPKDENTIYSNFSESLRTDLVLKAFQNYVSFLTYLLHGAESFLRS